VEERQRREHAEADTLRATVRLSTLEQLLAQLRLAHSVGELENAIAAGAMPAGK
ncbi:integrase, partial [Xanthomonas euvesicatoria]